VTEKLYAVGDAEIENLKPRHQYTKQEIRDSALPPLIEVMRDYGDQVRKTRCALGTVSHKEANTIARLAQTAAMWFDRV